MFSAKSSGNGTLFCNVGSTRVPPECPWIARKYRKCSDELGFKQYWNLFFWPPPFCQEAYPRSNWPVLKPSNSDLNIDATSSNLTAPSSSWWTDSSCCSNLIINFDTPKQPWLNIPGPMSIHFRSIYGIDTEDNVKVSVGRGLAFAKGCPVLLSPRLATGISSNVSVTIHDTNPRTSSVTKYGYDLDLHTVTSLMVTDRHLQDWTGLRVSTDPPFHLGWLITSRQSILSTWSSARKNCPFSILVEKTALEQSLVSFSCSGRSANFCSYSHNKFPCTSAPVWGIWLAVGISVDITKDSRSSSAPPYLLSLWPILHTDLLLLRRHWADWRK